jgi:pimeloyl-ACP methyl ester carboxylesterase
LRRLTVLEDTGHMVPLERPDAVIGALAELVELTAERTRA